MVVVKFLIVLFVFVLFFMSLFGLLLFIIILLDSDTFLEGFSTVMLFVSEVYAYFMDNKNAIKFYLYGNSHLIINRFTKLNQKLSKNEEYQNLVLRKIEMQGLLINLFKAPFLKRRITSSFGFNVEAYRNYVQSLKNIYLQFFKDDDIFTASLFDKCLAISFTNDLRKEIKNISDIMKKKEFIEFARELLESTFYKNDIPCPVYLKNEIYLAKKGFE